jgi:uncharacterized protein
MRPGDHPDFFRLAPPPGASRESTIAIDADGRFFHDGERVEHPALEKALRSWVAAHPDDGRPILTNGYDWTYFKVADAPLFVDALRVEPDGHVTQILFDGTEEPLDPATLSLGEAGIVYSRARDKKLDAKFSRHAQTDLGPLLISAEPPIVRVAGVDYALGRRAF